MRQLFLPSSRLTASNEYPSSPTHGIGILNRVQRWERKWERVLLARPRRAPNGSDAMQGVRPAEQRQAAGPHVKRTHGLAGAL